ncbi:hypothetical protein CN543_29240 [Bacillus toyonensis]|nr:hypothetical protein CN543_29240 [Bacillus toyonensis]PEO07797.1 hypothetical protein CN561_00455 [Bacillus toyonensis]PGE88993.1 hypothetical protein COM75_21550 [Bacillus toyonensis]
MTKKGYTVAMLCNIASVTRSGHYKWIKRYATPFEKQLEDAEIKKKIVKCHKKIRGIYGYRRVQVWLKIIYNLHINHKRVQRLMSELRIRSIIRRKRPYYGKKLM